MSKFGLAFTEEELKLFSPEKDEPAWRHKQAGVIKAAHAKCVERDLLKQKIVELEKMAPVSENGNLEEVIALLSTQRAENEILRKTIADLEKKNCAQEDDNVFLARKMEEICQLRKSNDAAVDALTASETARHTLLEEKKADKEISRVNSPWGSAPSPISLGHFPLLPSANSSRSSSSISTADTVLSAFTSRFDAMEEKMDMIIGIRKKKLSRSGTPHSTNNEDSASP